MEHNQSQLKQRIRGISMINFKSNSFVTGRLPYPKKMETLALNDWILISRPSHDVNMWDLLCKLEERIKRSSTEEEKLQASQVSRHIRETIQGECSQRVLNKLEDIESLASHQTLAEEFILFGILEMKSWNTMTFVDIRGSRDHILSSLEDKFQDKIKFLSERKGTKRLHCLVFPSKEYFQLHKTEIERLLNLRVTKESSNSVVLNLV